MFQWIVGLLRYPYKIAKSQKFGPPVNMKEVVRLKANEI